MKGYYYSLYFANYQSMDMDHAHSACFVAIKQSLALFSCSLIAEIVTSFSRRALDFASISESFLVMVASFPLMSHCRIKMAP